MKQNFQNVHPLVHINKKIFNVSPVKNGEERGRERERERNRGKGVKERKREKAGQQRCRGNFIHFSS